MMETYYWSRSAARAGQRCPLARFLEYDFFGRGLKKVALSMPLASGTYVHRGIEELLKWCKERCQSLAVHPPEELIDKAVELACGEYQREVEKRGFGDTLPENLEFAISEQVALVEALIRGFGIQVLPKLNEQYEVVAVELEELVTDFGTFKYFLPEVSPDPIVVKLVLQSRVDAILRQRESGDIYLLSLKTTSQVKGQGEIDERQEKATRHDMQGIVETYVVEHRLEAETEHINKLVATLQGQLDGMPEFVSKGVSALEKYLRKNSVGAKEVMGVIPVFLLKGKRYNNDWENRKENYSPLIRVWKQQGVSDADSSFAWSYKWRGADGKGHTLGKGWRVAYVWEQPGGVKEWVYKLAATQQTSNGIVEPVVQSEAGFCLPRQFYVPVVPIKRDSEKIERWKRQTLAFEYDRIKALLLTNQFLQALEVNGIVNGSFAELSPRALEIIDAHFPQSEACHYPQDCLFVPVCHEGVTKPLEGGYWWRVPHHKAELEAHVKAFGEPVGASKGCGGYGDGGYGGV